MLIHAYKYSRKLTTNHNPQPENSYKFRVFPQCPRHSLHTKETRPKSKESITHTHTHNMYMHAQKYPQTYTQNKHGTPRNVFLARNSYEFRVFPHSVFDIPCRKKKKDPILEKCFPNTSSMPPFGHSLTDTQTHACTQSYTHKCTLTHTNERQHGALGGCCIGPTKLNVKIKTLRSYCEGLMDHYTYIYGGRWQLIRKL